MATLTALRAALAKRAAYTATRREIEALPLDVALDLDLDRSKADSIAHQAVYGA